MCVPHHSQPRKVTSIDMSDKMIWSLSALFYQLLGYFFFVHQAQLSDPLPSSTQLAMHILDRRDAEATRHELLLIQDHFCLDFEGLHRD